MSVGFSNSAASFEAQARARFGDKKVDESHAKTMEARYQEAKDALDQVEFEKQARAYFGDAKVDASARKPSNIMA